MLKQFDAETLIEVRVPAVTDGPATLPSSEVYYVRVGSPFAPKVYNPLGHAAHVAVLVPAVAVDLVTFPVQVIGVLIIVEGLSDIGK